MELFRFRRIVLFSLALILTSIFGVRGIPAQDHTEGIAAKTQSLEPPLSDTRLTVHTLLREDIFAGFMDKDLTRFARGEKNIQLLLEKRPSQKANLLAWKGGAMLYRAVLAHEDHRDEEFKRDFEKAVDMLSEAGKLKTGNDGVLAITGGSYGIFADRLPKESCAAAWSQAYNAYQAMWKQQSAAVDVLPVHMRGELLGGYIMSAQRTGHQDVVDKNLDKMILFMRDTPYEAPAKKWKEHPESISKTSITCMSCHEPGRVSNRLTTLDKK